MKKNLSLVSVCLVIGLLTQVIPVQAAIISPPVFDAELRAGQTYSDKFTIFFTAEDPDTLHLQVQRLEFTDRTGEQRAFKPEPGENTLANWITLERTSIQKPANITYTNGDNAVTINYQITVPQDAPPGGHYAVIVAGSNIRDSLGSDTVALEREVTLQILVNLAGEQEFNTELSYFRIKDNQQIFSSLPVEFETLFTNKGNVHVTPRGNVEVFQGGSKLYNLSLNPGQVRVLPGKTRSYHTVWSEEGMDKLTDPEQLSEVKETLPSSFWEHVVYQLNNFRFGYFTASLQGFAGEQPPFLGSVGFWVIPWHLLFTVFGFVAVVVLSVVTVQKVTRRQRRSNR